VLMGATNDMDKDLQSIMAEVKSMTNAKQKLRDLINRVNKDVANNADKTKPSGDNQTEPAAVLGEGGMGDTGGYDNVQIPTPDPTADGGVRMVPTSLDASQPMTLDKLKAVQDDLKGRLDSMNEMSEMTSLRLQMTMDRRSKFIETLSNIMKKISTTADTQVQNLK